MVELRANTQSAGRARKRQAYARVERHAPLTGNVRPQYMSLLDKLRKDASHESDLEIRRQRLAKIDGIESDVRDFDQRLAALNATLAESAAGGRKRFFSWIEFMYGLGAIAALIVSFYLELPPAAWIAVLCAVVFSMVGIHMLVIKSRLKKLDR